MPTHADPATTGIDDTATATPVTRPADRAPARFTVDAGRVLKWIASAVDSTGDAVADTYGIDDTFSLDGSDLHDRIQTLVAEAQTAGVLAIPNHDLQLWQVADEGFLLTIDPPSPPRLCSLHLPVRDLLPDLTSGSVAAVAVLTVIKDTANQLLDEQTTSRADLPTAARAFPTHPRTTSSTAPHHPAPDLPPSTGHRGPHR